MKFHKINKKLRMPKMFNYISIGFNTGNNNYYFLYKL